MGKTVTFLSTRRRGMTNDLKLIQNYLQVKFPDISYRYYIGNELINNIWKATGQRKLKNIFCQDAEVIICVDGSLSGPLKNIKGGQKKILMAVPFDYLFKTVMESESEKEKEEAAEYPKKPMLIGFTHIIVPSLFCRKVLEEHYDLTGIELIENGCTPCGVESNNRTMQEEMRCRVKFYFPESVGKKIIAILINDGEEINELVTGGIYWKKILDHVGNGGFVLTNSEILVKSMAGLPACYHSSVGYMKELFMTSELLSVTDMLITNSSTLASYFAARRKEIYCMAHQSGEFGRYIKKHYPEMYLGNLNELTKIEFYRSEPTDFQKEFNIEHSYSSDCSPFEKIADIIQN